MQDKKTEQKKEPIEIHCPECGTGFRLWVPLDGIKEWEEGTRINCIKCGAPHLVRKTAEGFEASLLRRKSVAPAPAAAATAPAPAKKIEVKAPAPEKKQKPAPAPVPAPEPTQEEALTETILLIDDDRVAREMVQNTLKDIGLKFVSTKNAAEALRVLRTEKVNLIVTDLYLKNPGDPESLIDGEDLLKRIVASGMNIPSIITTGKDLLDDIVLDPKWFDLQVKGFIQKGNPFWVEELKLKIKEVMYKD